MKRGSSGLCFVVGIDKPVGCTSHDVVNRCRRIFGEKRIGHTGTLDPLASGAMAVCVGPATKLSDFLTFHDKAYVARIVFGAATATDDAEGEVIRRAPVPAQLADAQHAEKVLAGMRGRTSQLPPAYSAVKVGGVKSYEAARAGAVIDLKPREVEVYGAQLVQVVRDGDRLAWDVRFEVSAGTYVRSLARDLGNALGTCAHVGALRRLRSGRLPVSECVSIEALERDPNAGRLDPVRMLGCRYASVDAPALAKAASNGARIPADALELLECGGPLNGGACSPTAAGSGDAHAVSDAGASASWGDASCTPGVARSARPLEDGEVVALLKANTVVALYAYEGGSGMLKSRCGFAQGVSRGIV